MIAVVSVPLLAVAMAPWLLARWLGRLPYAPECPHCRTVTGAQAARGRLERAYERLTATALRSCAQCGWAGRMRWRLAPQQVAGRH
jgi:hypothetical protein